MEDIDKLIAEYRPNDEGVALLRATKTVLLVGITGAGKNTIRSEMMKTGEFHDLVTSVTREPRYNNGVLERDGVEYHFLTQEQAVENLKAGEYVEVSPVHGRVYGVTVEEVRRAYDAGKIALSDVDVLGIEKYKKLSDDVIAIFLLPPSYEEWQRRVQQRYESHEAFLEDWPNRRESAARELRRALEAPYYHFVINDTLPEAVSACLQITHSDDKFHRKDDEKRLLARDLLDDLLAHEQ